ncbi:MAG: hypothetical protein DHS80DRAFT_20894 [Piptocephalis tieghemiana]|nr:MAG: hypothetical protein DHS80DRAFT_20894 [Piptocephalis tieghemiana]
MSSCLILAQFFAFTFPPFSIWIQGYGLSVLCTNLILTMLGWIPGIVHAYASCLSDMSPMCCFPSICLFSAHFTDTHSIIHSSPVDSAITSDHQVIQLHDLPIPLSSSASSSSSFSTSSSASISVDSISRPSHSHPSPSLHESPSQSNFLLDEPPSPFDSTGASVGEEEERPQITIRFPFWLRERYARGKRVPMDPMLYVQMMRMDDLGIGAPYRMPAS